MQFVQEVPASYNYLSACALFCNFHLKPRVRGVRGQTDQKRGGRKVDRTFADASVDPSGKKRNTGADVN